MEVVREKIFTFEMLTKKKDLILENYDYSFERAILINYFNSGTALALFLVNNLLN